MSERQYSWFVRAERWGRWFENLALSLLIAGLISLTSLQIIMRNILSMGYPWSDSLVRLMVLWLALVGGIAASRDQKHLSIDIVTRSLPVSVKRIVDVVIHLFTATVTAFLAWHSYRFVGDSYAYGDTLSANWPAWIFQIILPIGFAAIFCQYILRAVRELMEKRL